MRTTASMLADIPDLAAEAWLTWGTRVGDHGASRRPAPDSRVLADLDRLLILDRHATDHGLGILTAWVRAITTEMDEAGEPHDLPRDDVTSMCVWLTARLRWCVGRGFEAELHDDIRRLWSRLRGVCGIRDRAPWPCLTIGCHGSMRLVDDMLECEHDHRHDGLRKWRHHPSMLASDAAEAFGVPLGTIRQWRARGLIHTDEAKSDRKRVFVWPWDIVRLRYPDLVELLEIQEGTR